MLFILGQQSEENQAYARLLEQSVTDCMGRNYFTSAVCRHIQIEERFLFTYITIIINRNYGV